MQQKRQMRDVFPACLLTGGRPCVVVGGGTVAARKVRSLLDAGAAVTVVSPALGSDLDSLAASSAVAHVPRAFEPHDIEGAFLVFAATDDRKVNRRVVACCHERGILCCSVDANWTMGDFVSPATLRDKGLVVAVSTGGRSCRRSRLLKESFARHLATVAAVDLVVVGTSHHHLAAGKREPHHLMGTRMQQAGDMLRRIWGMHEFFLLNTCNRIELVALAARDDSTERLMARVLGFDLLRKDEYYVKRGFDAFTHVAMVTAGMLSQTPGEHHIVAQVKEAVEAAVAAGWAGGTMQELLSSSLRVARDVRAATKPLLAEREIEDIAVEYMKAMRPRPATHVLVVGTGGIGTSVIQQCAALGFTCDWCCHRAKPAIDPSWKGNVMLCAMADLPAKLRLADVVVCATASPGHVLRKEHVQCFNQHRDVLVIDLAMPRNVDPALDGTMTHVHVADLDELKRWSLKDAPDMVKATKLSRQAIEHQRSLYERLVEAFAQK